MIQDFINQWNGKALEVEDSSNLYQCFDLALGWCDAIGLDRAQIRTTLAKDVWTNHGSKLTPTNSPQPGDFVVWGTQVGPAGHIAVFVQGTPDHFQSFDQNWDHIQKCLLVSHTNYGVLGFLHPEGDIDMQEVQKLYTLLDQTNKNLDSLYNIVDTCNKEIAKLYGLLDQTNKRLDVLEKK